jgi:hypothetical protein
VTERTNVAHPLEKWQPFLQDGVVRDTPKNILTVELWQAKAPVNKKSVNKKEFLRN